MRRFTPSDLKARLQQHGDVPLLLDVREEWEFDTCHIAGSELIPMGQIPEQLDALEQGRETVIICHHGIRSRQVAYYLEQMGFKDVINLEGGVEQWACEIDPAMPRY